MSELYLGLMSGTSLDGIDAALVRFDGTDERPAGAELVAFRTEPYGPETKERLLGAVRGAAGAGALCDLGFDLGDRFAAAALGVLAGAGVSTGDVVSIGSHGQTVWHRPPSAGGRGSTLQIGEAAVIAERTGIDVVADFRVRDVAAGGQGAPLTPYFDRLLLSPPRGSRAIQNVGGIANVTALPAGDSDRAPLAFDTGPGVALIDDAVTRLTDGRRSYDEDGRMAAAGEVLPRALDEWLSDPFFRRVPPRSTGRERFGGPALDAWLVHHGAESPEDLVATLTELTARTIADAYAAVPFHVDEVLLCGGGARNPEIRRRLEAHLPGTPLHLLEDATPWDGDAREAAAFALLARQHVLGIAPDLGWATGASAPRILGKRTPA